MKTEMCPHEAVLEMKKAKTLPLDVSMVEMDVLGVTLVVMVILDAMTIETDAMKNLDVIMVERVPLRVDVIMVEMVVLGVRTAEVVEKVNPYGETSWTIPYGETSWTISYGETSWTIPYGKTS